MKRKDWFSRYSSHVIYNAQVKLVTYISNREADFAPDLFPVIMFLLTVVLDSYERQVRHYNQAIPKMDARRIQAESNRRFGK